MEPLRLPTPLGAVALRAGALTLNGVPAPGWRVTRWAVHREGQLVLVLTDDGRAGYRAPHYVPDTAGHRAILESFVPSDAEVAALSGRLVRAEHHLLTRVALGTAETGDQDVDAGLSPGREPVPGTWRHAGRLRAAEDALRALGWWDWEGRWRNEQDALLAAWQAIEAWLALTPWHGRLSLDDVAASWFKAESHHPWRR